MASAMDDFVIDTTPTIRHGESDVPHYGEARKSIELTKSEKPAANQRSRPQLTYNPCWNCGQRTHSIRDCQADNNTFTVEWYKELQSLMKTHDAKNFQKGAGRYHQNDNINKYSNSEVGQLSPTLRNMMGLKENELPSYIYRLRKHGYPKAWRKYATVKPSGLNLYDAHGKEVAAPDTEDGEVFDEDDKLRYDLNKFIKFPGFNAPAPENTLDNYEIMNASPYTEDQSLENMITELKEKAMPEYELKRDRSNASAVSAAVQDSNLSVGTDMKIESHEDSFDEKASVKSTSFIPPSPCDTKEAATASEEEIVCSQSDTDTSIISIATLSNLSQNSQDCTSNEFSQCSINTPPADCLGRVLSSTEGTPLRKSTGYTRLPPVENFSKDICDVINFENLPESTGTFEKMRGLLKKVQRVLKMKQSS